MKPSGDWRTSCTVMETTPLVTAMPVVWMVPPGFCAVMEQLSNQHSYSLSVASASSPRSLMSSCVKPLSASQPTRTGSPISRPSGSL